MLGKIFLQFKLRYKIYCANKYLEQLRKARQELEELIEKGDKYL